MKRNYSSNININSDENTKTKPSFLCNFGYVDYILLASTIAIALGEELSSSDLNVLASFFAVLSDELALIAAVEACAQDNDNGNNSNDDEFVFVPPDVSMTRNNHSKKVKKKKTIIKRKIKKKKVKNRKDT